MHRGFRARRLAGRIASCVARRAMPLIAAAPLAACVLPTHPDASAPPPDPFNPAATQLLDNTRWQLVEWKHADGTLLAVPGAPADSNSQPGAAGKPGDKADDGANGTGRPVTLDLSTATGQRHASGFSGCNRYAGTYTLKNGLLSFGPLAGTRMACVGAGGEIEQPYLDALAHISRTGVQMRAPRQLLLLLANGDRLTFAQRGQ
ncbi:heat-shock protein [Burkholderia sp. WAC0059]|uniref:META domain-containing protein n=1 Tax=Burkholderia sp. WAC0059 TaxID=2066022 RepID=UPI000C7F4F46|nr:META domain-containing protein [Burkholderia sp. WAC0059]PLZ01485.1 heat-shock protein [Burkholderia sp. WAC0059]